MSSSHQLLLLQPDRTPLRGHILGSGRAGVIIQRGNTAIKLPLKYGVVKGDSAWAERLDIDAEMSYECLQREKEVYRRLGQHRGIVSCLDLSGIGIQMTLMTNGNLREYLSKSHPDKAVQLAWFRDMAHTLAHIHDRRVIVADIATRNFLLSSELSIKFLDFTESSVLPLDADMQTVDDNGYSIFTDIGQFGNVMYEVVTGQMCEFDLFKGQPTGPATAAWPRREDLPNTQNIWLGTIIEKCWTTRMFKDSWELLAALDLVVLE